MGRGQAAQQRPVAARPNRGEVARLETRGAVSDAVDARVLAQQRAGAEAMLDLRLGHVRAPQLGAGHDAVRRARDLLDRLFHRPALWPHSDH